MKKLALSALAIALLLPFGSIQAAENVWRTASAETTWNHGTFQVDRLDVDNVIDGPISLGDYMVVKTISETCTTLTCKTRDAVIVRDGSIKRVNDVPDKAFDQDRYRANNGRVVWAQNHGSLDNVYSVFELDLMTGEKALLVEDVFFNGVDEVIPTVAEDRVFFTAVFNDRVNFGTATVHEYDYERREAVLVTQRYWAQHEELVDVDLENNRILTVMTFPGGEEQLWVTQLDSEYNNGWANRVVGTWTPSHESIVAAQFRDDEKIEYFRFFRREVATIDDRFDTLSVGTTDDLLNWYRPEGTSVYTVDKRLVWVSDQGTLFVTYNDTDRELGMVAGEMLAIDGANVLFETTDGRGHVYNVNTEEMTDLTFLPRDVLSTAVVGTTSEGHVIYYDTERKTTMKVGYGDRPVLSGQRYVYWRGLDGKLYQGRITSMPTTNSGEGIVAMKIASSSTVYLTDGESRWTVTKPGIYFSYFDSWASVRTASVNEVSQLRDAGVARAAAGTLLSAENDARVYYLGENGALHWVRTEIVARGAFGTSWNKNVVEITSAELMQMPFGEDLEHSDDVLKF